ncbi:MAG: hypothetical protein QOE31_616 [Solirubrobacteraceae bacterium]|nr:hypothetical protein [Solirubrobacteraceae bacterium]
MPYATITQNAPKQTDERRELKFTVDELVLKAQSASNQCCAIHISCAKAS